MYTLFALTKKESKRARTGPNPGPAIHVPCAIIKQDRLLCTNPVVSIMTIAVSLEYQTTDLPEDTASLVRAHLSPPLPVRVDDVATQVE